MISQKIKGRFFMAAIFTTWQALYLAMLDIAVDFYGGHLQIAEYTMNTGTSTRQLKYRTETEFRAGLEYVKKQAQQEMSGLSVLTPAVGRTYAKNGGGRW